MEDADAGTAARVVGILMCCVVSERKGREKWIAVRQFGERGGGARTGKGGEKEGT